MDILLVPMKENWKWMLTTLHPADIFDELEMGEGDLVKKIKLQVSQLDVMLESIEAETEGTAIHVPKGIPSHHWWFRLTGCSSTPVC